MQDYWRRQTSDKPLFPDMLWSRPEHKAQAGKLLVIGGNLHGFAAPAEAFAASLAAGAGSVRVLLPDAVQKIVGGVFEAADFAPSTPSGSFAKQSLALFLEQARWADGVLVAGDLGRNSETAIVLEQFVEKYQGQLTLTKDAADYFTKTPAALLKRTDTTLVLSLAQLQQLARNAGFQPVITFSMNLLQLVEALHQFSGHFSLNIVVKHQANILVAVNGQVSSTKLPDTVEIWRVATAAHASVWWLQNPARSFESLTTSIVSFQTN